MSNIEKASTIIEVKHYIECPYCQKSKNRIDHLFCDKYEETNFGIWYCDECGGGYKGVVKGTDVFIEKVEDRKDNSLVFLKNGNVLLVVKGAYFDGKHESQDDRYFYEENQCPTNYLKDVEMVVDLDDGEIDPHGIFKFALSMPYPENLSDLEFNKMVINTAYSITQTDKLNKFKNH